MIPYKNLKSILLSFFVIIVSFLSFVYAQEVGQIFVTLDNVPVQGAVVTAFGKTSTTDSVGLAKFDSITAGNQDVKVNYNGREYVSNININSSNVNLQLSSSNVNLGIKSDSFPFIGPFIIISGILLVILGIKLLYDRVKNLDYRSRLIEKKLMLSLGGVACFVFVLGVFGQILSLLNPSNNFVLNQSINAGTNDVNCICNVNICSNSCSFDKLPGTNYSSVIKCSREQGLSTTEPTESDVNSYCRRSDRTKGDADGINKAEVLDYMYYVRAVNGGLIPTSVNPDFNGDGVVSRSDRDIIVQSLKR